MKAKFTVCLPVMLALVCLQSAASTVVVKRDSSDPAAFTRAKMIYSGEVTSAGIMELITSLDEIAMIYPAVTSVSLYLNSEGGSMEDGYMAYEAIKNSLVPVTTINSGEVASAATLLYCAGKERLVFRASTFLMHPASTSNYLGDTLNPSDLTQLRHNVEMGNDLFRLVYSQCTNLKKDQIEAALFAEGGSMRIGSDDAIRFNMASRIANGFIPTDVSYYITPAEKND